MKRILRFLLGCLILCEVSGVWGRDVEIFPDYNGVTLPPNIAPLNFYIKEAASAYRVKWHSISGEAAVYEGTAPEVVVPVLPWRNLLSANKGQPLYLEIELKDQSGQWHKTTQVTNHIANEPVNSWLAYRFLRAIFNNYCDMGIYQRNLESFEEREILHNSRIGNACINCHGFQKNDPGQMAFHVRLPKLMHPMVQVTGQDVKVIQKTFTYYSWNPQTNVLAYTANAPSIFFHTWGENREVYDRAGEVFTLNLGELLTTTQPNLATPNHYESWPSWDNKGEYLYFCRAPDLPQQQFAEIRFDLLRTRWDAATGIFAEPEMMVSGWTNRLSTAQPRVSPDGNFLVYTLFERGIFPIFQPSADLYLMNLETRQVQKMECNSPQSDSWHCWSSEGRWLVFSSKRMDGLFARPHFAYIDETGHASKPFVLPQEDPHFYEYCIKTFNVPELITGPVEISPEQLGKAILDRKNIVKTKSTHGAKSVEKELPPEEGYQQINQK